MSVSVEDYPMIESVPQSTSQSQNLNTQDVKSGIPSFICVPPSDSLVDRDSYTGVNYDMSEYPKEVMKTMFSLFQSGRLTDVTLRVGNLKLQCHKVVLASASPYFRAMFTNGMKEENVSELVLHCITPLSLHRLVHFAYSGHIRITEQSVCEILTAATMLQMNQITVACSSFLESQLHASNALGIYEFSNSIGCLPLTQKVQQFIDQHFSEIAKHDELLSLTPAQLTALIKRDELHVRTEAEVYNTVVRWVNHDTEGRQMYFLDSLAYIRCHDLPPAFISGQIKNCALLSSFPESKQHMKSILKDLVEHRNVPTKHRMDGHDQMIYSAGGYLRYSLSTFEGYSHSTGLWRRLPDLPSSRSGLCACSVRGLVYLVGGRNNNVLGNIDVPHMDCFDPVLNVWRTCSSMSVPRNRVAVGVIDDMIYAVGGSTSTMHHRTVEKYDVDLDLWTPVTPMHRPRVGLGVAVINRLLYAVGGFDGACRLSCVERYNPETEIWTEVTSLNRPRSGVGVVSIGQNIYTIGGYDSSSQLRSVERYDVELNHWEYTAPMIHPRSALSVAVLDGKIWAFGGYDGNEFLSSVEVYDPACNQWVIRTSMPCGKSGHAVVTSREPALIT